MTRRWVMIAFAVSVALNLFFLGIATARFWQHRQWRMHGWADPALNMAGGPAGPARRDGHRGPRRRGEPFPWLSQQEREELRPKREALIEARRDAEQVLVADPLNLHAVGCVFAAKGRETQRALPLLINDFVMAEELATEISTQPVDPTIRNAPGAALP